LVTLS
jgi:hypothetical protein